MKTFIIAATSLDGYIAQDASQSSFAWTSREDKKRFIELTKRAGVVVMGRTSWQTIGKALKDRLTVVYTRNPQHIPSLDGVEATSLSPAELLHDLESRGYKEVAICGGSEIYTMFMEAGVVDEMYITIEPVVFGSGVRLFTEKIDAKLELIASKQVENSIFLEYVRKTT